MVFFLTYFAKQCSKEITETEEVRMAGSLVTRNGEPVI